VIPHARAVPEPQLASFATMTETIDLVGMGLAWEKDIKQNARFRELTEQIKHKI